VLARSIEAINRGGTPERRAGADAALHGHTFDGTRPGMLHLMKPAVLRSLVRNTIHWLRLPDARQYTPNLSRPIYRPYKAEDFRSLYAEIAPYTLVSPDRVHILYSCARQALALPGDFIECGVYRGGTAMLLQRVLELSGAPGGKKLLLFDTFEGMPENDARGDSYRPGEMSDTTYADVCSRLDRGGNALIFKGLIPATFDGLGDRRFAFAHIDVDIYRSIKDCCEFIYPRLNAGGWMVFDDYGFPSCAGGRRAIEEFFADKPEVPVVLPTGQALIAKLAST
jgi:O-methyltransferase